jgi:cell division control protein 6
MAQFSLHCITSVETLHFAPYTLSQLLQILQTRLTALHDERDDFVGDEPKKFLPIPTLTLLTKKIAAQTGDVRSLFEVLRGAIDNHSNIYNSTCFCG